MFSKSFIFLIYAAGCESIFVGLIFLKSGNYFFVRHSLPEKLIDQLPELLPELCSPVKS